MKQVNTLNVSSELLSLRQATILALKESQYTYGKLTITCSKQNKAIESINEKITSSKSRVSTLEKNLQKKRKERKQKMMKLKIVNMKDDYCSIKNMKNRIKNIFNRKDVTFPNFFRGSNEKNQTTTIVGNLNTSHRPVSNISIPEEILAFTSMNHYENTEQSDKNTSQRYHHDDSTGSFDTFLESNTSTNNHTCRTSSMTDSFNDDSEESNTNKHNNRDSLLEDESRPFPVNPNGRKEQELLVDFCTSKERRHRRSHLFVQDLESDIAVRDSTILQLERRMAELLDRLKEKNSDQAESTMFLG
jgi:uncharacterized coiled-coil protein SlyX